MCADAHEAPGRRSHGSIVSVVPRYDFRCRQCSTTFEVDRPMAAASDPARCPAGHADTVKLLSTVALGGRAGTGSAPAPASAGGGGCCGGGCCA
jgi:putative FmdB family regulatory protein